MKRITAYRIQTKQGKGPILLNNLVSKYGVLSDHDYFQGKVMSGIPTPKKGTQLKDKKEVYAFTSNNFKKKLGWIEHYVEAMNDTADSFENNKSLKYSVYKLSINPKNVIDNQSDKQLSFKREKNKYRAKKLNLTVNNEGKIFIDGIDSNKYKY